jgi:NADPH2:quinone reductase
VKQIQMKTNGGPEVLSLQDAPLPTPKDNDVLIEVHASGVNRPDLAQREGSYPPPPGASPILGLEVAGKIVSAPQGSRFKVGDSVCALVHGGGYAEFCLAPEAQCLPIPQGFSMEEAAGIPETFFTVWANVFQMAHLNKGEKFLVHGGTSGIGTTAIQLAHAFGAEVYATAGSDEKCKACVALGAQDAINYKNKSFEKILKDMDVILDMIGGDYTAKNIDILAPNGRLVQIATQGGAKVEVDLRKIMQKRLIITGSTMRPRTVEEKGNIARELFEKVWPLLESKKINLVIDKVFSLQKASEAHTYLESGQHIGKVILRRDA